MTQPRGYGSHGDPHRASHRLLAIVLVALFPVAVAGGCSTQDPRDDVPSTGASSPSTSAPSTGTPSTSAPSTSAQATEPVRTELAEYAARLTNPVIRELPLRQRVRPATTVTSAARTEAITAEGIWMITRPEVPSEDPRWPVVHSSAELMLLSADRGHILASYPFEGVPPQWLLVTVDAVYCGRSGDGALPDSMVARLGRGHDQLTVVYSAPAGPDGDTAIWPDSLGARPGHWRMEAKLVGFSGEPAVVDGDRLLLPRYQRADLVLDAATLAVRS